MLCPVSTGKSGSSWLDRLRTAKGFTEDGVTDLEEFIQNPNSPSPETMDSKPNSVSVCDPSRNEDTQLFNIMSDVLNELFNFGDSCTPEKATLLRSCEKELDKWENEREGVGRDGNLVGFSRTEVTVIDTSYELWKFEKFLYRKKNVWKVRDRKVKSETVGSKKKRKVSGGMEEEDRHGGKKSKVDTKEGNGEECELPLNEVVWLLVN
ncbi:hypothetical protein DH2020_047778 [Rehmannia glutinosa]|uniref:Uncharacterized protein n=1 Tax=Rehmannia glutinosa TaxID=99300 RepID=A0ABR0U8J3_REHGL